MDVKPPRRFSLLCLLALAAAACGDDSTGAGADGGAHGDSAVPADAAGVVSDGGKLADGAPADHDLADGATPSLAQRLTALTAACNVASTGKYATDQGGAATVDVCRLTGAFFWKADMDVDCDGQQTAQCSPSTDPAYQNQTSFEQSNGQPLIASSLPYIVIPLSSSRFNYATAGIKPGALAIVLYNGQIGYGVFGDEGPSGIIGEASYAMASSLGINPDPSNGGTDTGVTYIVFTGTGAVVSPIENHANAVTLGGQLATTLLQNN